MLVSWKWLHDYVTVDEDVTEYCNKMIMSGSNLETCKKVGDGIEGVLVGKIEKIEKQIMVLGGGPAEEEDDGTQF